MQGVHEARLTALRAALAERGIGWLWIEPSVSFFYLTGLHLLSIERLTGLVVSPDDEMRLVVPLMLAEECAAVPARTFTWTDDGGPGAAVTAALAGVGTLHVQGSLPAWAWAAVSAGGPDRLDIDPGAVASLRAMKDPSEIDALARSGSVTDEVMAWVASLDLAGVDETRLARRIQIRYLEQGVLPSESPLVASGSNAAMPHYAGGEVPIATDRPLLLDFGCALDGYWSDITRLIYPADMDAEVRKVHAIVREAYDAALTTARPGTPCREVDRAARKVIGSAGYGEAFVHRTGHGIGLEMHEAPYIREGNDEELRPGHCFSIEPGIYLSGRFGVRYENIVCITDEGVRELNLARESFSFR